MNFPPERSGWYAMAKVSDLKRKKPLQRFIFDTPIVLFGTRDDPKAMVDRCPHRGAALSGGRLKDGNVQCPYHGWTFDGEGLLVDIPCLTEKLPMIKTDSFETCVHMGLIFIKIGEGPDRPYINPLIESVKFWKPMPGDAKCPLAEAAENFLDPTHTLFVHKHLVRAEGKVNRTRVVGTGRANIAEMRYYGEGAAGGLVSKVMGEKDRALSVGRFIGPNVAEVEFHGPKRVNFIMTGFITPISDSEVGGYGIVGLPGNWLWARIKFAILYPWIKLVHSQDKGLLGRLTENRKYFPQHRNIIGALDFIRPQINAILSGKTPPAAETPFDRVMDL